VDAPRRVVTGTDAAGRAVFVSDGAAPRSYAYRSVPGMRASIVWATDADARPVPDDPTPSLERDLPSDGETRLVFVTFAPDAVFADPAFDAAAAGAEDRIATPMLSELFEADDPGMHRSNTIDYAVVVEGEIHLELDDGAMRRLRPGDVVIQNATRHRWRNFTERPATVAFTWIGVGPA
jgi:mannose-6-phosphate isomerase-like protein (cupin superfamily)